MLVPITIIFALVGTAFGQGCSRTVPSCVGEGAACNFADQLCFGGQGSCAGTTATGTGVCAGANPNGLACTTSDCPTGADGVRYECVANVCQPLTTGAAIGAAGDSCTDSTECSGDMSCTGGVCVGFGLREVCTSSRQCALDADGRSMFCRDGVCRARRVKDGEVCVRDDDCENYYSTCVNREGISRCTHLASREEEQTCNTDLDCEDGLYCSGYDNRCAPIVVYGAGRTGGPANCSFDSDLCNGRESANCGCLPFVDQVESVCMTTSQGCHTHWRNYFICLQDQGCHHDSNRFRANSCAQTRCGAAQQAFRDCGNIEAATYEASPAGCSFSAGAVYNAPSISPAPALLSVFA